MYSLDVGLNNPPKPVAVRPSPVKRGLNAPEQFWIRKARKIIVSSSGVVAAARSAAKDSATRAKLALRIRAGVPRGLSHELLEYNSTYLA